MTQIGIIGAGAWGLALAAAVQRAGSTPIVWSRRGAAASTAITVTGEAESLAVAEIALLVTPAQELAATLAPLQPHLASDTTLVICAKGIARPDHILLDQLVSRILPGRPVAVLSGPSFAAEVASNLPTAVTIACGDATVAQRVAAALGSATFRPYVSTDPVGVQLGGAIKNVIAIACGIVAGRNLGENARAALMTRGLAETARLGRAMGADPATFAGLAGLGDLSLTATSATSRNFRLGLALGEGKTLAEARATIHGVIEGVATAEATVALAARHGVEMPIARAVAQIVERGADIGRTISELLARPFKSETA